VTHSAADLPHDHERLIEDFKIPLLAFIRVRALLFWIPEQIVSNYSFRISACLFP